MLLSLNIVTTNRFPLQRKLHKNTSHLVVNVSNLVWSAFRLVKQSNLILQAFLSRLLVTTLLNMNTGFTNYHHLSALSFLKIKDVILERIKEPNIFHTKGKF